LAERLTLRKESTPRVHAKSLRQESTRFPSSRRLPVVYLETGHPHRQSGPLTYSDNFTRGGNRAPLVSSDGRAPHALKRSVLLPPVLAHSIIIYNLTLKYCIIINITNILNHVETTPIQEINC
jgi:hypothetical protein